MSAFTLGIIGSGQLGTALVKSAKKLNIRSIVLSFMPNFLTNA